MGVVIMMNGGPGTVWGPRAFAAFEEYAQKRAGSSPPLFEPAAWAQAPVASPASPAARAVRTGSVRETSRADGCPTRVLFLS